LLLPRNWEKNKQRHTCQFYYLVEKSNLHNSGTSLSNNQRKNKNVHRPTGFSVIEVCPKSTSIRLWWISHLAE
jgi:hypothetical protein